MEAQLAPQLVKLADGAECRVGVHVLATRSSSRGAYFAGDFGTVTALKGKDVFVRWDHNGETTIASAKRLQVARGVRLASGRPARPGMTVKLRPDPQSSNRKPSKAWTGTILRVLGANKVKVQWHGRHSKQETLDAHRLHAHDDRTVRIAAYNIGTHCQTLRVRGSEAMTVKRMVEVRVIWIRKRNTLNWIVPTLPYPIWLSHFAFSPIHAGRGSEIRPQRGRVHGQPAGRPARGSGTCEAADLDLLESPV